MSSDRFDAFITHLRACTSDARTYLCEMKQVLFPRALHRSRHFPPIYELIWPDIPSYCIQEFKINSVFTLQIRSSPQLPWISKISVILMLYYNCTLWSTGHRGSTGQVTKVVQGCLTKLLTHKQNIHIRYCSNINIPASRKHVFQESLLRCELISHYCEILVNISLVWDINTN